MIQGLFSRAGSGLRCITQKGSHRRHVQALRRLPRQQPRLKRCIAATAGQAGAESDGLPSNATKASLRKMAKAELEVELQSRGLDVIGTKPVLVDRLYAALHTEEAGQVEGVVAQRSAVLTPALPLLEFAQELPRQKAPAKPSTAAEVQRLRAQVAELEEQLRSCQAALDSAAAARVSERQQIDEFVKEMAALKAAWHADVAQLEHLSAAAARAEETAAELEEMHGRQADFAERISSLQTVLQDKEAVIASLQQQLEAVEVNGGGSAEHDSPWTQTQIGIVSHPLDMPTSFDLPAPEHHSKATDITKTQGTPGLMAAAGVLAAHAAWRSVRRAIPADRRLAADAAALLAAGAALYALIS